VQGGRIPLYRFLEHVSTRVAAAAAQFGLQQHPTMKGRIDGDVHWPIFVEGPSFAAAFPHAGHAEVTAEVGSLSGVGFPPGLIDAWSAAIPSLNTLQIAAVNDYGVLKGEHLVVSAPTSSGKTMVGELAALRSVLERRRAIFLLPLKALVADKRRHFDAVYGPFGIRTIEATGETDDISPLLRGKFDIALLTYEKFAAIALTFPHVLAGTGVVVIDEVQMITDKNRGANLEFLLTLIRMRRREGVEPQTIALSAVIGDTSGLEQWLGGRLLRRTERPVPLDEGILRADGTFRFIDSATGEEGSRGQLIRPEHHAKGSSRTWLIPLVRHLLGEGQQVIVFRETKSEARHVALYLAENLHLPSADVALDLMPTPDPSLAHRDLRSTLTRGVAFHHADLIPEERKVVEDEFRRGGSGLRVIVATTTLAMGVNTPASSVVIVGLMHPQDQPYSVAEYKNLVGRAGRLGFAEKGSSYLLATDQRAEYEYWTNYVTAAPEDLASRFLQDDTDARSLIVRVMTSLARLNPAGIASDDIVEFLEASFGAFQAVRTREGWKWDRGDLVTALVELERFDLISNNAGLYRLTGLGRLAGESGTEVSSIIRLVACLRPIAADRLSDPDLIAATQVAVELDQVHFPMNRKSRQEPQYYMNEMRRQLASASVLDAFHHDIQGSHTPAARAKRAFACLMFVAGTPMSDIERTVSQFGAAFGGISGPIRGVASRTADILPTTGKVAEIIHPGLDLRDRIGRLTIRLTYGVPGAAVDLAREAGAALLRGNYRALVEAGLHDAASIASATDAILSDSLGGDRRKVTIVREAAAAAELRGQSAETPVRLDPYVA
jgi:helicase